jgi:hypothetical protein
MNDPPPDSSEEQPQGWAPVMLEFVKRRALLAATMQRTRQLMHEFSLCLTDLFNTQERAHRIRELGTRSARAGRGSEAP